MSIKRKVDGEWRTVGQRYRKVNGQWRQVTKTYRKIGGEWRLVYSRAPHQQMLYGLENFAGTYKVERRADGTIYCEVDGRVTQGTSAQFGLIFTNLPNPANINMVAVEYFKSIYQENDLIVDDAASKRSAFQEGLTNWPINIYAESGMLRIFLNLNISYSAVKTHFIIKDLTANDIPM